MNTKQILDKFHEIAVNPAAQKNKYLAAGKKVVLVTYYTPEELIHSMGLVPMSTYGASIQVNSAKQYYPAYICSLLQTMLELGMNGAFEGASAIVIPSLCDSLKVAGQNWKVAVPSIPFIPMTYPQNRKPEFGKAFALAGVKRAVEEIEKVTGAKYCDEKAEESIKIYNEHNAVMREFSKVCAAHPEISAQERSDVFTSAGYMLKEEHTAMVKELIESLGEPAPAKKRIYVSGILADSPALNAIFDEFGLQIAADDVLTQSRMYRTDAEVGVGGLKAVSEKFCALDNCSVLYDPEKKRLDYIVEEAKSVKADGIILVLTKFCDPEEFDNPLIKKAADAAGIPCFVIEIDQQMQNFEQARTMVETFKDMI